MKATHPVPRDEWNLARYLAKRGGLRPGEDVVHVRPGMLVIEANGFGDWKPVHR
jgi:hypothetical protein